MIGQSFSSQMSHIGGGLSRRSLWEKLHIDVPLLCALAVLLGFGLLVLYSATDGNDAQMRGQITYICLAMAIMFVVAQVDVRVMRRWAPWMYLGTLLLLVGVMFYGLRSNGAQRWLDLPGLPPFQPSEIMKIVLL